MIFVTVGTTAFDSLIRQVDIIAVESKIKFVCQIAHGRYTPKHCDFFRFKPSLKDDLRKANIVIAHGGAGTLFELMKMETKVIAVPNLDRIDAHQTDLINALASRNHIMACHKVSNLREALNMVEKVNFSKYISPECTIAKEIIRFIGG